MRSRGRAGIAGLLAALAVVGIIGPAQAGSGPELKFTRIGAISSPHVKDDHVMVNFKLSAKRGVVGRVKYRCRIVEHPPQRCSARSEFREGVIRARGASQDRGRSSTLPIVGGSGVFRNAQGSLKMAHKDGIRVRFVYVLDSYG